MINNRVESGFDIGEPRGVLFNRFLIISIQPTPVGNHEFGKIGQFLNTGCPFLPGLDLARSLGDRLSQLQGFSETSAKFTVGEQAAGPRRSYAALRHTPVIVVQAMTVSR